MVSLNCRIPLSPEQLRGPGTSLKRPACRTWLWGMMSSAANQIPVHLSGVAVSCQQVAGISAHSTRGRIFFVVSFRNTALDLWKTSVKLIKVTLRNSAPAHSHLKVLLRETIAVCPQQAYTLFEGSWGFGTCVGDIQACAKFVSVLYEVINMQTTSVCLSDPLSVT